MLPDILEVIQGDFCIGCGACSVVNKPQIVLSMDKRGQYVATIRNDIPQDVLVKASRVCPFSHQAHNESEIASTLYSSSPEQSDYLGFYRNTYAGYSAKTRKYGSSGGIITWLLLELLESNKVDYVITVVQNTHDSPRFEYAILSDRNSIIKASGSVYYPIKIDDVIQQVLSQPGRYAFVGLPCFNRALRLLRSQNNTINERISYQIGLVCGHLKTAHYYQYILRRLNLNPNSVESVRFRKNNPQSHAANYLFEATARVNGTTILREIDNVSLGDNWGMGLFKPNACDFCDDVFSETADIVVMDAWLPEYVQDYRGTSLIITRDEKLDALFQQAVSNHAVQADKIDPDLVIQSQVSAIRHRRRGLSQRLHFYRKKWLPKKRVETRRDSDITFRMMQRIRRTVSAINNRLFLWQMAIPGLLFYRLVMWPIRIAYRGIQVIHYVLGDRKSY